MRPSKFTPTQERILDVLSDGLPHKREELIESLQDETATRLNLNSQLTHLRARLRPAGHEIVCELKKRTIWYRHVLLLPSSDV